jgi:hypothetical protein
LSRFKRILCLVFTGVTAVSSQGQSKNSPPLEQFEDHVAAYLKLRKTVTSQLPQLKPTASAQDLATLRIQLASGLAKARASATQGTLFTPDVANEFRRLGKLAIYGRDGKRVEKSLKNSEPVHGMVGVNQSYPPGIPLQTMPPTLLQTLPHLPKELEYRLVDRTLLLLDSEANLIIDYLPEAIP